MTALASVTPIVNSHYESLVEDWLDTLRAEGKSPNTVATYMHGTHSFRDFLVHKQAPLSIIQLNPRRLQAWMRHLLATRSDATANNYFRGVRSFCNWLVTEGEVAENPMANMKQPTIGEKLTPIITTENLKALVKACAGNDYTDLRDLTIIRLFIDSGCRLAELTNVRLDDVDKTNKSIVVTGKGSKQRTIYYGPKAAVALNRYLRARARHPHASNPALWLGKFGPMTRSGIYQIARKRAQLAGFTIHPHQFRHTFAHEWKKADGNDGDLMALCGWSDPKMLHRYGKSAAAERAGHAAREARTRGARLNDD